MDSDGRHDTGAGGLPWSSLLDPVANAKALGDVQARGLRAAGELVERLVRSVDGDRTTTAGTEDGDDPAAPAGDVARLLEVWIDLLRRTADSFGRLGDRAAGPSAGADATVDVGTGSATGRVRLELSPDGAAVAAGELWIHNGTATAMGPLALHAGDLQSADGSRLASAVTFSPAQLPEVPARSSRGIVVGLSGDEPLTTGTYRALIQATGAPDVWLPVEVVVDEASG